MTAERVQLYPLFLKLEGRPVLVVGAGEVAQRKIVSLLDVGAAVRVVAPAATEDVKRLAAEGRVVWEARGFEEADADGVWLVVAATSDAVTQKRAAAAAEVRRVLCLAVDDPANASAYSGSVVRRPPFTVAISSGGATPALTRLVREMVEHVLPGEEWVEHAVHLRERWKAEGTPVADRFAQLVREIRERQP